MPRSRSASPGRNRARTSESYRHREKTARAIAQRPSMHGRPEAYRPAAATQRTARNIARSTLLESYAIGSQLAELAEDPTVSRHSQEANDEFGVAATLICGAQAHHRETVTYQPALRSSQSTRPPAAQLPREDPFAPPHAGSPALSARRRMQDELLAKAEQKPQILARYSHIQEYLRYVIPAKDERRYILDAYEGRAKSPEPEPLPLPCETICDSIEQSSELSDLGKVVPMMTILIPPGYLSTYEDMAAWIRVARFMCLPRHIAASLRKSPFELGEVPTYRVLA